MFKRTLSILLFLFVSLSLGTIELYSFPWNYDMWEQPGLQPYELPLIYPKNSITTDGKSLIVEDREKIEQTSNSPIQASKSSLKKGEKLFNSYCTACHGENGKGNGLIIQKGAGFYPVDLTAAGVKQRTDGYIYAYIRYGGKVMMPSYGESINKEDAWHIVNYIRKIQKSSVTTQENQQ